MSKTILWVVMVIIILVGGYFLLTAPAQETGPIKIGVIGPLTGDAAVYGEPIRNVIALAASQINNAGGIDNRPIEMIYEDGKCNGKDAASAMQKLANVDKVKVVIGGFCSSESLSAVPIATEAKIILLSIGSSSPDLSGKSKYFFRNYPSDNTQGKILADISYNNKGWKNVAIIQEQLDYPLGIKKAFENEFTSLGGKVEVETFLTETNDFRTQLTKLKGNKPDALFISVQTPQAAENILRQVKELKWNVNLLGADVIPGSSLPSEKPNLVEGMIVAEFGYDKDSLKFQKFEKEYTEMYNKAPEYLSYSQTAYDGLFLIKDAIEASGGVDTDKMVNWLESLNRWEGVSGFLSFDENHDPEAGHKPEIIKDGKVIPFE